MKTKVMYFAAPARLMTREEIAGVFAKLGKDSEVTLALRQILTERTAEVVGAIADSRLPAEQRTHAAGRLEEIMSIHAEIAGMVEVKG
jgi:hypothetical protein